MYHEKEARKHPSPLPLNPTTQPSALPLPVNSSTTTEEEDPNDAIYTWVDSIPLSRPKRNTQRDFSDGVATAEVIHHYIPKRVDLHNYPPANGVKQKLYNWATLDQNRIPASLRDDDNCTIH
ncbi:uncharacterized protein EV422DRAFT_340524 [Fimicolochytrium jonesii]|uniref:uncharacterized protein n=1 Tax=Fimicolochytrium jonesii TaxID=1396493 RepID=UPI0022FE59ED|nr:uncharacterized protein EV422DRAFT_340524 [Fimicolochytrium jonesii]KAI8815900.1 hypothetical protein EV422DRAFT_340524 [Fimicolochytrium jonesii]